MWHAYNVMLHVSFAIGLIDASDKYLLRAASMARSFTFPWSTRSFEFLPTAEQGGKTFFRRIAS
jgi:hypothetical protein